MSPYDANRISWPAAGPATNSATSNVAGMAILMDSSLEKKVVNGYWSCSSFQGLLRVGCGAGLGDTPLRGVAMLQSSNGRQGPGRLSLLPHDGVWGVVHLFPAFSEADNIDFAA